MPDTPIEPSRNGDYSSDMNTRVALLEGLAQQSQATAVAIQAELRGLRDTIRMEIQGLRDSMQTEIHALRESTQADTRGLRQELLEQRRVHERDFRITFGAIITTTLGLAYLIAHVAHWL